MDSRSGLLSSPSACIAEPGYQTEIAALIALAAVIAADLSVRAPLRRVLGNPIKFVWSAE
jgi:hypothetical protein